MFHEALHGFGNGFFGDDAIQKALGIDSKGLSGNITSFIEGKCF